MSRIFRKNVFTGEYEEATVDDIAEAFEVVNAASRAKDKDKVGYHEHSSTKDPYAGGKDFVSKSMSIAPEQATPQRIEAENAAAAHRGTGAYYSTDGRCHLPTRGVRAREMARKNRQDNDAGYSDHAGR